jgi:superfamily II DNA or RNA helicase
MSPQADASSPISVKSHGVVRQRLAAEELTRRRPGDDLTGHAETFRRASLDANPHQLEAALFALERMDTGGAMLCDEVGLGKTIETGIVLTQLRSTGRENQLIVVPLSLAAQWQTEMANLFGLSSTILDSESLATASGRGLYIVGRELATSPKWLPLLEKIGPWDLVVVDEAHEMFSTIHQRFKNGRYLADLSKGKARRAAAMRQLIGEAPALVLTATPLQNSLHELWSLVSYTDRQHRTLGAFHEFCQLFCKQDGRLVVPGMEALLRQRLEQVIQRTLRSQAQPWMARPFTTRRCLTVNFHMSAAVRHLYEEVDAWISGPMTAYKQSHRHLLNLMLRRRMGSSPQALAASLDNIRIRIEGMLEPLGGPPRRVPVLDSRPLDLDEPDLEGPVTSEPETKPEAAESVDPSALRRELIRLDELQTLAQIALEGSLEKFDKMLAVVKQCVDETGKVVIFTESRKTLDALSSFLEANGFADQVTCLSGSNEGSQVDRARLAWKTDMASEGTVRGALVHEFKTRTQVLISTEAGAKGLNLQFCSCLINFDLPWNPQRVEQRIGRVHRYGQERDVLIVNCVNLDNEAEMRVYEILKDKLQLFEGLFGISDQILGTVGSALDLEHRVNEMLDLCPTPEQRQDGFDKLNLELGVVAEGVTDERLERARSLLTRLDASVQERFKKLSESLPAALTERDQAFLDLLGLAPDHQADGRSRFDLPEGRVHLGAPLPGPEWGEPLNLEHPAVQSRLAAVKAATDGRTLVFDGPKAGRFDVYKVQLGGLEQTEEIAIVGTTGLELGELLSSETTPAPPLDAVVVELERRRLMAEQRQRSSLDRLVRRINGRRETQSEFFASRKAELEQLMLGTEQKRRAASSMQEKRESVGEHTRLSKELLSLEPEQRRAERELEQQLTEERAKLERVAYVKAEASWLFGVQVQPKV